MTTLSINPSQDGSENNNRVLLDSAPYIPCHWSALLANRLLALHPHTLDADKTSLIQTITKLGLALDEGHTCINQVDLSLSAQQHPLIVQGKHALQTPAPLVLEENKLFFYRQWLQEAQLATKLKQLLQPIQAVEVNLQDIEDANTLQQKAILCAAQSSFTLITGGPGTGKTYTLVRIVKALQHLQPHLRIALAAPTGKAAQRMQSVLQTEFARAQIATHTMQQAQTVHRLLGLGGTGQPKFNAQHLLPFDLIVIDEGSMLDLALASQLFAAIAQGTRVIILGDANQLAAVDAGAVLADLSQSKCLQPYHVHLLESKRFAADKGIGKLADLVLKQDISQLSTALNNDQVTHFDIDHMSRNDIYDALWQPYQAYVLALQQQQSVDKLLEVFDCYRILCASKHGYYGTRQVNQNMAVRLQQALHQHHSSTPWYHGRPVMMTRNDYGLGLSNGDIGLCLQVQQDFLSTDISPEALNWFVYFPNKPPISVARLPQHLLETAFALTIHKSQGSEFTRIAMLLDDIKPTSDLVAAPSLNSRELIYTAITRAKQYVDVWASIATLSTAICTQSIRFSGLLERLESSNSDRVDCY